MNGGSASSVWAPLATTVSLLTRTGGPGGAVSEHALARDPQGWWSGPSVPHGIDYAFSVDGGPARPDPRSPWQPHGVHEFSRSFDARAHAWSDADWAGRDVRGAVLYELHVGTFTREGTLDAIDAAVLADLAARGIEMIELMPLAPFPGERGWGYDGVCLYAVHEPYGGPAALQRFVDAAHGAGIAVCLDMVYNHLGPDGNYLAEFGPYFTQAHETPWGWAVNLDGEGAEGMRRYILDNAARWFADFHIDALRLDAVHALIDESPRHVLAELADATAAQEAAIGRPLSLIAESDLNQPGLVAPTAAGGLGMRAQWADDVHHALHAYLTGERHGYYVDFGSADVLDKAFRSAFVHDGVMSTFRGKTWGAPVPDDVDRRRFVVFASNHDQVGNRGLGDRPSATLSPGAQAAALALVLLGPFTPLLFMGEEYGETRPFLYFTDHGEPLGTAVTAGRLAEFGGHGWEELYGGEVLPPDPQSPETFSRSTLDREAAAASAVSREIEAWVSRLMAARALTLDDDAWTRQPVSIAEPVPRQLVMTGPVSVHANLSREPMPVRGRALATFGESAIVTGGLVLGPDSVAIVAHVEDR